jgi:hypothetical protein
MTDRSQNYRANLSLRAFPEEEKKGAAEFLTRIVNIQVPRSRVGFLR